VSYVICRDAAFAYDGGVVACGLDFVVNAGDYLCVVGENGSGKSTLLKGLLRLKAPQSGKITLGGGLRQNEIGYLPQQTPVQKDFPASVYEVALSGRLSRRGWRPFYTREDKAAALSSLRRLGAEDLRKRCYRELSAGQQQRVLLARALCGARKLLLLDEPMAGLDPAAARELYGELAALNRGAGLAIVMVSHDVHSALEYASHVLHLQNRQVFFGTAEEYRKTPEALEFLGDMD
jgi:zinc transport system ATP-binding protein